MDIDRTKICEIISEMLDNPDEAGIYPTSTCYARLECYCELIRVEAIGWAHANCCATLDKGGDPRLTEVPAMLAQAQLDLNKT